MRASALLFASVALPGAAAWALAGALLPSRHPTLASLVGRMAVALLAGQGLASLLAFAWLLGGGGLDARFATFDGALFLVLSAVGLWAGHEGHTPGAPPPVRVRRSWLELLAGLALVMGLLAVMVAFFRATRAFPHGHWDAWSIWNLRARLLLRLGPSWRAAFDPVVGWSQTGYPLLLPLAVARGWAWAGESPLVPAVLAAIFTASAPVVLAAAVARTAGAVAGAVAASLLLATQGYRAVGVAQYADVPLAALLLAALAVLGRARAPGEGPLRTRWLLVAGLLLGLAGWAKHEGIAAACVAVLVHLLAAGAGGGAAAVRDLAPIIAGAALPAAAWIWLHAGVVGQVAPALAQPDLGALLRKLADPERWRAAVGGLWAWRPGREADLGTVAVALSLLLGARPRSLARQPALLTSGFLVVVYAVVYVTTPQDLAWHVGTSAERVLLHGWPAALLGLFLTVPRPPDGACSTEAPRTSLPDGARPG